MALPPDSHRESPSWARKGLDMLLARYSDADLKWVSNSGPWWAVDLSIGRFAIWKETGAVYHVDESGASHDDPFLVPEGSPYDGPVESGA